jgi:membrane protease YdiL (CAAX protease family)
VHRLLQPARPIFTHIGLGLAVTAAVAIPWSALVVVNVRLSPHLPWAIPAGVAYAWLAVAYLGGRWPPRSTSAARRRYFRAHQIPRVEFLWAFLAGLAAISSLWLLFAALGRLSMQAPRGAEADLPLGFVVGAIVIGAAVTAIAEEGGLRGFMQAPLERLIGPAPAIATTSVCFVLIHLSHGVAAFARTAPFYLAAGCVYGLLAYLTQSILPSLLLHSLGDVFTFAIRSSLVQFTGPRETGTKASLIVLAVLGVCASTVSFLRLARLTRTKRSK